MSNYSSHSHSSSPHNPTKAELAAEEKAEKAEAKAEKESKEAAPPKVALLAFDADRFTEELRAVVNDKGTTPNNPALRTIFAELATALDRSRTAKPTPPEKAEKAEKADKPEKEKA